MNIDVMVRMAHQRLTAHMLVGSLGMVFCLGAGLYHALFGIIPPEAQVEATITKIKLEKQRARFEFIHPQTGDIAQLGSSIPDSCEILIDGKPATLANLRVGDKVTARGLVYPGGRVVGTMLHAHRVKSVPEAPNAKSRLALPENQPDSPERKVDLASIHD